MFAVRRLAVYDLTDSTRPKLQLLVACSEWRRLQMDCNI